MPKARLISTSTKMPEQLTDRQCCFKCNKTVTGKKKLFKCAGCHAITYCSQECQAEDWSRHRSNCVPVMVTDYEGKGRGLVAARDIKMGELIFKENYVIKLDNLDQGDIKNIDSIFEQLNKLPDKAKLQFNRLMVPDDFEVYASPPSRLSSLQIRICLGACLLYNFTWLVTSTFIINNHLIGTQESLFLIRWAWSINLICLPWIVLLNEGMGDGIKDAIVVIVSYLRSLVSPHFSTLVKFAANCRQHGNCYYLSLNIALINHSCSPNVAEGPLSSQPDDEFKSEVRAIKDISRGDEITKCYFSIDDFKQFCHDRQKRIQKIQEMYFFDCKCSVCSGSAPGQEARMKKVLELSSTLTPNHHQKISSDWRSHARTLDKIVEMSNKLHVGRALELKFDSSTELAVAAHLARDEDLLGKALENLNKLVEDTQFECLRLRFESVKQDLAKWANQLKSRKSPKKGEFDSLSPFLNKACILE